MNFINLYDEDGTEFRPNWRAIEDNVLKLNDRDESEDDESEDESEVGEP